MTRRHPDREQEPEGSEELGFEEALGRLEQVIRDLEDGRLPLSESLQRYEEGVRLLKQCHLALNQAERKILLLTGLDEDGNPVTQPFDDESLSLEEKRESRSRRRTSSPRNNPESDPGSSASRIPGGRRSGRTVNDDLQEGANGAGGRDVDGDMDRQKGLF